VHHEHINKETVEKFLLVYVITQHMNNKISIGQTTGFVDKLSIMWSTSKAIGSDCQQTTNKCCLGQKFFLQLFLDKKTSM